MQYAAERAAFFAQPPRICHKCARNASLLCVACELVYCAACFEKRHRKGSFARHDKVRGLRMCEDCEEAVAVVECSECAMLFCRRCSEQMHSLGAMQAHKKTGVIAELISALPPQPHSQPVPPPLPPAPEIRRMLEEESAPSLSVLADGLAHSMSRMAVNTEYEPRKPRRGASGSECTE